MKWVGSIGGLITTQDGTPVGNALNIEAAKQIAAVHNAEMEKVERTIHRIAESVTKNAGAIQNRIGELERIKHVKHH